MEAVLARVRRLGPECREALDQLSVVPSRVSLELAAALLGPLFETLAEAEVAGVIEVRADSLAFRHELARRAIERSLPAIRRRQLNAASCGRCRPERPERARLMHHAVEAGDVETILAVGPGAAREAALAGSHRQALAHYRVRAPAPRPLGERERAEVLDAYGWELYNAHRFREAVAAGARGGAAVRGGRRPGGARRVPRARLAAPVHGRRDGRGRAQRRAGGGDARADRPRRPLSRTPRCTGGRSWR